MQKPIDGGDGDSEQLHCCEEEDKGKFCQKPPGVLGFAGNFKNRAKLQIPFVIWKIFEVPKQLKTC